MKVNQRFEKNVTSIFRAEQPNKRPVQSGQQVELASILFGEMLADYMMLYLKRRKAVRSADSFKKARIYCNDLKMAWGCTTRVAAVQKLYSNLLYKPVVSAVILLPHYKQFTRVG